MATWVALLRAINLGARNKVPMPALRTALGAAGLREVRTHLQSGNVVFESRHRGPGPVASLVHDVVHETFGVDQPVAVRTPAQIAAVRDGLPFESAALERPRILHVHFLLEPPSSDRVASLLADPDAAAACRVVGDTLYIDYGASTHGSRYTGDYLRRRLGVEATARNWRTVLALIALTGG